MDLFNMNISIEGIKKGLRQNKQLCTSTFVWSCRQYGSTWLLPKNITYTLSKIMRKRLVPTVIFDGTKESGNDWTRRRTSPKNLGCYGDGGAILRMMMLCTNFAVLNLECTSDTIMML
jgi:hypothetical protein